MRDSLIVFVFFAVGVALGYADAVPTWLLDPDLPMIILSVMVVLVSLGLGAGDNLHYMLRTFNWRMFLLPLCTIVGTLLFSALGVLVLRGFSLTDCLAVGSGFGYYSLSSVLIADLKSATLGVQGAAELATVALLANVVREMIALFGMPLFARWGGPLAPISVSGVTSMDVCLPSIARYSGSDQNRHTHLQYDAVQDGQRHQVAARITGDRRQTNVHRTGGVCADSGRCLLLTEGTVKKNRQKAPFYRHLSGPGESPAGDRSVVNRFFDKTGSGAF